jgi:hypothetical protein
MDNEKLDQISGIVNVVAGEDSNVAKAMDVVEGVYSIHKTLNSDGTKLDNIADAMNELSEINKTLLGAKGSDLDKAVKVIGGISEINKTLHGNGSDLSKVLNVINEVSKINETLNPKKSILGETVKVISAFPGVGKTWLYTHQTELGLSIVDSDSSEFSWISKGVRHPDFPNNYIKHIKECIKTFDVVLVSSHDIVRDALRENGIMFITVYPDINDKEEYIQRFIRRGSPEPFVKLINDNWNEWISNLNSSNKDLTVQLNLGEYLSDFVLNKHNDNSKLNLTISGKF